jgi:hypothetical protein
MNERIQKLADNATHYANGVCDADPNADWYATRDKKFAELIVRECADVVKYYYIRGGEPITPQHIKKHFGVEE